MSATNFCLLCGYLVLKGQELVEGYHKSCVDQLGKNCEKFVELWKKQEF